ncbi:hypothetical protein TBLA_0E02200 [Henningerozyma blattae CBS 6284]|uniref:SWR1-complex protein 3 n=1 Tax=Henningerozyma blattae (strain ATCC 34711 / CBS 6284 / DSM 70876 / NBRC 10599 / NRRL Y-10934 / UCD 77-7) TaxID=1071380 RepID=I2H4H1_HENB6|nr:hypothetical protein TBLA_0E02200 [Tetrapisispora blattae CBS 6284]CCH61273.1 hypothetical protein TBLA_0E02200 [Tetrapisispora blattae CBS 6284]
MTMVRTKREYNDSDNTKGEPAPKRRTRRRTRSSEDVSADESESDIDEFDNQNKRNFNDSSRPYELVAGMPSSLEIPEYKAMTHPLSGKDSAVLYHSLVASRKTWITGTMFEWYWSKPIKLPTPDGKSEEPGVGSGNSSIRDKMQKMCDCKLEGGPHMFPVRLFILKNEEKEKIWQEDQDSKKKIKEERKKQEVEDKKKRIEERKKQQLLRKEEKQEQLRIQKEERAKLLAKKKEEQQKLKEEQKKLKKSQAHIPMLNTNTINNNNIQQNSKLSNKNATISKSTRITPLASSAPLNSQSSATSLDTPVKKPTARSINAKMIANLNVMAQKDKNLNELMGKVARCEASQEQINEFKKFIALAKRLPPPKGWIDPTLKQAQPQPETIGHTPASIPHEKTTSQNNKTTTQHSKTSNKKLSTDPNSKEPSILPNKQELNTNTSLKPNNCVIGGDSVKLESKDACPVKESKVEATNITPSVITSSINDSKSEPNLKSDDTILPTTSSSTSIIKNDIKTDACSNLPLTKTDITENNSKDAKSCCTESITTPVTINSSAMALESKKQIPLSDSNLPATGKSITLHGSDNDVNPQESNIKSSTPINGILLPKKESENIVKTENNNTTSKRAEIDKHKKLAKQQQKLEEKSMQLTAFQQKYTTGAELVIEFSENAGHRFRLPFKSIIEYRANKFIISWIMIHNTREIERYKAKKLKELTRRQHRADVKDQILADYNVYADQGSPKPLFSTMTVKLHGIHKRFASILLNSVEDSNKVSEWMSVILERGIRLSGYNLWYQLDGYDDSQLSEKLREGLVEHEENLGRRRRVSHS